MDNVISRIPAGAFEEDKTIEECIIREVKEEVGLEILELELIGFSSKPKNEIRIFESVYFLRKIGKFELLYSLLVSRETISCL